MKHSYLSCDKCGYSEENAGCIVHSLKINTGREMDASGNGYVTNWDYFDLCADCLRTYKLENPHAQFYDNRNS